jgi:hypothetical protein
MKFIMRTALQFATAIASLSATIVCAQSGACGEVVTLQTHGHTTTRYALASPPDAKAALVLLAGGGGHLDLDDKGCPRALTGNSLVVSILHFHALGFAIAADHAEDLGKVIADVRKRTQTPVWLAGTSRGAISAANAAARLSGVAAPDGLVLTSAVMYGNRGLKTWVTQTVFDTALEAIRMPVLVIGHAEDKCQRAPPDQMDKITARTNGAREQVVTVTGGPGRAGPPSLAACEGRAPHAFFTLEAEVAAGIARFIRGGQY